MEDNQLIYNWELWSVIVASLAIILSQLPPLHILFRKSKLDLEIHSRIFLSHSIGNPWLQINLIIRNIGGKTLRIQNIYVNILRDNKKIGELKAENYYSQPTNNQSILLTNFNLKPDEEWNQLTHFINYLDQNDARKYEEANIKLQNEIHQQQQKFGKDHLAKASDEYINPFNQLFEEKFIWQPGDYEIEVIITSNHIKLSRKYRFIIFESMTEDLKKHREGYPMGDGIYWFSNNYKALSINVEDIKS